VIFPAEAPRAESGHHEESKETGLMKPRIVHVNDRDTVVISLYELAKGDKVTLPDGEEIIVQETVPTSHKIAIVDIRKGQSIYKYGEVIGVAAVDIPKGGWVHAQHIEGSTGYAAKVQDSQKG
jgi:altronate dehydratase small subunit